MGNENTNDADTQNGVTEVLNYATSSVPSGESITNTTSASSQSTAAAEAEASSPGNETTALFRDENGKPLFPLLYNMRRQDKTFTAVKQASQQAFNAAQTGFQKGFDLAQSKLRNVEAGTRQQHRNGGTNDIKDLVNTPFGTGILLEFRQATGTYVVELASGGILYTKDKPSLIEKPMKTTRSIFSKIKKERKKTVLELNATFMEWEKAKQDEVEKECHELNITYTEEIKHKCFTCLKENALEPKATVQTPSSALFSNAEGKPVFPLLYKWRQSGEELVKENTKNIRSVVSGSRSDSPCLLCASVCCSRHSSTAFRKEGVTLCHNCVQQLEENHHQSAKLPQDVESETQRLVDLYGRALLLLQYCTVYMLPTADQLERQTKQHNEIAGVGGSSAGLASGVLGVVAAATST